MTRAIGFDAVRPVGNQAADGGFEAIAVHRGQFVLGRQLDNQVTKALRRAACHDQTAIRRAGERGDGALDLAGLAYVDRGYIQSE
jgi:hypothetical protein